MADSLDTLNKLLQQTHPRLAQSYRLEFKNCFGAIAGYVNGNIFVSCGSFGVALRLPPSVLVDLFSEEGVSHLKYFPNGHIKKEYAVIPPRILGDRGRLKELLRKSVKYAVSLAPAAGSSSPHPAHAAAVRKREAPFPINR